MNLNITEVSGNYDASKLSKSDFENHNEWRTALKFDLVACLKLSSLKVNYKILLFEFLLGFWFNPIFPLLSPKPGLPLLWAKLSSLSSISAGLR